MDNKETDAKSQSTSAPTAFLVDLVSNRKIPITTPRCRVGRDDLNDIVITGDQSISRFHFIINKEENQYSVQDAKSRHGTFLNGNQISGPEPINDGDVLKIGVSLFWFVIEAPAQADGEAAPKADGEKAKIVLNPNEADMPATGATQDINQLEIIDKLTSLTEEAEAKSEDKEEAKEEAKSDKEVDKKESKKDKKDKKALEEEAAKEKAEKEKAEKEKAEKEKAEKEEAEAKEKAAKEEAEAKEKAEREEAEAKEKAEKERAEKEEAEAKEKAEREEAEAKEKAEREEAEAKEKAAKEEAEAKEKAEREEAEAKEKAEKEEAEAKEKAEKEEAEAKRKEEEEAAAKEKEASESENNKEAVEVSVSDLLGPLHDEIAASRENDKDSDNQEESSEKLSQNDTLDRFADIIESSDSGKNSEESKSDTTADSQEEREAVEISAQDTSNISSSTRNGAEEMTIQGPSTVPDWCKRYFSDELKGLNKELDELNEQIRKTQDKIKDVESQASLTKGIRNTLLVSEGDDLIEACKKVLGLIGWKVTQSEEDKNELMLEGDGDKITIVRIIWTNTNAERSHLGQLSISQTRYWCEKGTEPKGVLIVSKPGDKAPTSLAEESDEDFTDFASKKNVCLMSTLQLLSLYREAAHKNTKADELRGAVYDSKGWLKGYKLEPGDAVEEGAGKSLSSLLSS